MEPSDGNFDAAAAWNRPVSVYNAPTGSWEDTLLRQANLLVTMDRRQVARVVRPHLPCGDDSAGIKHRSSPSAREILYAVGRSVNKGNDEFSGSPAGYSGSPANSLGGI